jgi:hypothetical protein
VNSYGSEGEMCLGFSYFAYNEVPVNEAPLVLYAGLCDLVQNEGFPNENNAFDAHPFWKNLFCHPTCPLDPTCPK